MKNLPDWAKPFKRANVHKALHWFFLTSRFPLRCLTAIGLLLLLTAFSSLYAQPAIQWDKTIGGNKYDGLIPILQARDGGYILAGFSPSGISGDKTEASKGENDFWLVKLDAAGNKLWDKTIGGDQDDFPGYEIQETSDGGYIWGGNSASGISGDKTAANQGSVDYWVLKLDADGNKIWDKTIGGNERDYLETLKQTRDGGYILGGWSDSGLSGDKSEASKGGTDLWLVKLDADGNKIWDKTIGGNGTDNLAGFQKTKDGGYILGGSSVSDISGDKTEASNGMDYWVVKLGPNGSIIWDKTIGGTGEDASTTLKETSDAGYIIGGTSNSPLSGDKTQSSKGESDFWVVKLAPFQVPPGGQVKSFALINADNEQPVQLIHEGEVLNLATLPSRNLNIRIDVIPATVGSVSYALTGTVRRIKWDNTAPYALFGDDAGNYNKWITPVGSYTLTATPYSGADKTGTAGTPRTINFSVIDQTPGQYTLNVPVPVNGTVSKIPDQASYTEGSTVQLTANPAPGYVFAGWTGDASGTTNPLSVVMNSNKSIGASFTAVPAGQQVTGFTLINANNETAIQPLTEGQVLNLAALPSRNLNIRIDTNPAVVGSVGYALTGTVRRIKWDNTAPYSLFGDDAGNYNKWITPMGSYTLTATPYSGADKTGTAGTPLTINFTVIDQTASTTSYIELNNLVVVYKNANKGSIPDDYLPKLTAALEEAKLFYWRHSHMGVNIKWTIYVIEDYLERVRENNYVYPHEVDADLRSRGFTPGSFDAVGAIIVGGGAYAWGVNLVLGRGGYFQVPWWGNDHLVFTSLIVHEFHHEVDAMFANSGYPLYPHNHPGAARVLGEYIPPSGTDWDLNAAILRYWPYTLWPDVRKTGSWGTIKNPLDADGDTIPDNDANVPLDEARFKSSPSARDTDRDGITDLQEAMAGIFTASNPLTADSDGDLLPDDSDPEPIYPLNNRVPFRTGLSLAQDIATWPLAGRYLYRSTDISATSLHLANSLEQLYVGVKVPIPNTRVRVFIDANNDGYFHGKDNLEIILNGNLIEGVNLYDASSVPAGDYRDFIISPLPTTGFSGITKTTASGSTYQLIMPRLSQYDLDLTAEEEVGMWILFDSGLYRTLLEPNDYLTVTLGGTSASMLARTSYTPAGSAPQLVRDQQQQEVMVFPNPATHTINVRLEPRDKGGRLKILNTSGAEQIRGSITGESLQPVDIAGLAPGLYLLIIDSPDHRKQIPFLKW